MLIATHDALLVEQRAIPSKFLNRYVIIDLFIPVCSSSKEASLLLINDGQDLGEMQFASMLNGLMAGKQVEPFICAGIHAGKDRKNEYGVSAEKDFAGRGARADAYKSFVLEELLPFIREACNIKRFSIISFAGFSLGGLSAIDIVWSHPDVFSVAGVFSGSLWWRSRDLDDEYNDDLHRIMHQQVRKGTFRPGLRFYFTTGSLDETADRNKNGIIDSIDDTLALIDELKRLGYKEKDICYINFEDGAHDVATWGRAMPGFLLWAWGKKSKAAGWVY